MARIRIKEDPLNEMALASISSLADNLPFQIILKLPDHDPPHAHILSNDGKKELGQILIPKAKPRSAGDIKDYKGKLSDADRMTVFAWINRRSKRHPKGTNLDFMNSLWGIASK